MKRLGVLGTMVWDRIWAYDSVEPGVGPGVVARETVERQRAAPLEQWGGIAYSIVALSAACPPGWTVVPLVRLGTDLALSALDFLHTLPNVSVGSGVVLVPEDNNRVELRYFNRAERSERLMGGVSGWGWEELSIEANSLDALYINFVSGFEIDLPTAQRVADLPIPTYADLHSLYLGEVTENPRRPRRLPDWEDWFGCFDVVQLNENELALTGSDNVGPRELMGAFSRARPRATLATRGGEGADFALSEPWTATSEWGGRLGSTELPAGRSIRTGRVASPTVLADGDPTGCGDVWGSVVFANLLEGRPLAEAMGTAHTAAAAKVGRPDIAGLREVVRAAIAQPTAADHDLLDADG